MAPTAMTTQPRGVDRDGLSPTQLRLLGLPYGRVASWLWDFFTGGDQDHEESLSVQDRAPSGNAAKKIWLKAK